MRYLYTVLFYLALPAIFIRLWWKGKKTPAYRQRWAERLGYIKPLSASNCLWVHAVSLGEMIAAKPLIEALSKTYPEKTILVTTMTVTGSNFAQKLANQQIQHVFIPYDIPDAIHRFLNRTRPLCAVVMETELWPNLLYYTARRNIPILLANARLSQASMQGYLKIRWLIKHTIADIRYIAAQTQADAERFLQLGAKTEQLRVLGNLKFDVSLPHTLIDQGRELRRSWGEHRPTLIAASTHATEEEKVLTAFTTVQKTYPNALLILVPRHPERFNEVANLLQQRGFAFMRRSEHKTCDNNTTVFLGDSVGEMFLYYAMTDIVFIGGSFIKLGGHNPLEPAALSLPIITGDCVFNFREVFRLLHDAHGAVTVVDETQLAQAWLELLGDEKRRLTMGENAQAVVAQNRGALARHVACVAEIMQPGAQTA
jgi:3-deoxy-D-manno-octulosonic-acid transferase